MSKTLDLIDTTDCSRTTCRGDNKARRGANDDNDLHLVSRGRPRNVTLLVHGFIGISDLLFSDIKESVRWSSDKRERGKSNATEQERQGRLKGVG